MPGETEEMLWETINLNRKVKPTASGCNIFYPYRGTPLGDKCFEEGLVDLDKFNDFSNERRQSVLNYDKEWLDKLIYYHSNWIRLVNNESVAKVSINNFIQNSKSFIKNIPVAGPLMVNFNRKFIYRNALEKNSKSISFK